MSASPRVQVSADLRFSLQAPDRGVVEGTLRGSGQRLEVRLSDTVRFAGRRDSASLRTLAAVLAHQGLTVAVVSGEATLLEMGVVRGSWWQRRVTRSPHMRVGSVRGALTGAVGRIRGANSPAVLPGSELVPPATLFPIAPVFGRGRRPVTTTHDPRQGGVPRLVAFPSGEPDAGATITFPLRNTVTSIGSDPDGDIVLADLAPLQAVVIHDEHDEFVVHDRSPDHSTRVHGAPHGEGAVLRSGARITVGPWTLVYSRAEFADHGRPYGGRIGGEAGHQRTQPDPRPNPAENKPRPEGRHRG